MSIESLSNTKMNDYNGEALYKKNLMKFNLFYIKNMIKSYELSFCDV